jgi:hypothetical protein
MLLDCHAHTSLYSSCSRLTPVELCTLAQQRGLHGQVITEHRRHWPEADLDVLRAAFPGLRLYGGIELSLQEGYDVVCITGPIRLAVPVFPDVDDVRRAMDSCREEIFCFVAHPFRYHDEMPPELEAVLSVVDGIEMNSVNILWNNAVRKKDCFTPRNRARYEEARRRFGLTPLYNTDTHTSTSVASIANRLEVVALPESSAALARLLRDNEPQQWQNVELLQNHLQSFSLF